MSSRSGAALSRLVAPIQSSQQQSSGFLRYSQKQAAKPKAGPSVDPQPKSKAAPTLKALRAPAPPAAHTPLTSVVLELFEMIQERKHALLRWLGFRAYQQSAKTQRRTRIFRKGSMLDRSA